MDAAAAAAADVARVGVAVARAADLGVAVAGFPVALYAGVDEGVDIHVNGFTADVDAVRFTPRAGVSCSLCSCVSCEENA